MSIRTERVASEIKKELATILQKFQKGNIITITSVKMTPDLSIARVNLSILDPAGGEDATFAHLQEKKVQIRTELASIIRHQVRKIPDIEFFTDETAEYSMRMEELFRKAKKIESNQSDEDEQS